MLLQNCTVPTNSINKDMCNINQPLISHHRSQCFHPRPSTAMPSSRIILLIEDPTDINKELCQHQQNNARLQRQDDDCQLIADGQGKMSLSSQQQDTDGSPVGLRKAKTTALKNVSEFLGLRNL